MSLPRPVVPGKCYMLTRRCVLRMFLLLPDAVTRATFAYCLAEAAQRCGIEILLPLASTNHHHTVLYDRDGNIVAFEEHFHKMVAKALNAHWGRSENFWNTSQPSLLELEDLEAVIDALVYAAINPVKDGLVARAIDWPGYTGYAAFLSGEAIEYERPAHFFREDGPMPETVTLQLTIPPELGDADAIRAEVARRVEAYEAERAAAHRAAGTRVMGKAAVMRQRWDASPTSIEPPRARKPRFSAGCRELFLAAVERFRQFQREYRHAYRAWRAGEPALFPVGTYWLARFANAPVAVAKKI